MASGRNIYNKDERFRVLHVEGTDEWTLQIKYAALVDQGLYECQVLLDSPDVTGSRLNEIDPENNVIPSRAYAFLVL